GDFTSGRLLRDAARLSTRAAAGPFRSFGRIAVEPRPYQLVPLMMALKLDPVRLLIADDVGIGKTIEAAVIARELLDRGEIRRLSVLCPPHHPSGSNSRDAVPCNDAGTSLVSTTSPNPCRSGRSTGGPPISFQMM